jgi:hypothetical protein
MALDNIPRSTVYNNALPEIKRRDAWWVQPLATVIVFTAFIIYTTFRTFENDFYDTTLKYGFDYLSPFYSPTIHVSWMPFGKHFSPAIFILPVPLLFRTTCYYYRKAYYRAFFQDPTACAVKEPFKRPKYTGEREFPFVLQNIHRYAFYLAALVMLVLWYDTFLAFTRVEAGARHFGMGVGSIIFLINVVLLSLYTFSCHSWRHLTGGCVNCFSANSDTKSRHSLWEKITHLNENHQLWAWASLFSVAITDIYVRAVAMGAIQDFRFFN